MNDEEQIRALVDAWGRASEAGDLGAQLALMTNDVSFLTAGNPPMSRAGFVAGFNRMMREYRMVCRSNLREITVSGDLAVVWNYLAIEITPLAGGAAIRRAGDTLTVLQRGTDGAWRIRRDANLLSGAG